MLTPTSEENDMSDDKDIEVDTGEHDELPAGYEVDAELANEIEKIVDEQASDMVRIRVGVNVNNLKRGDQLTVERNHPFYSGLIDQGLVEVID
jgi:hypothetical protein